MFAREPGAVFWTFGFPLLLTVALGIAFRNRPPDPTRVDLVATEGSTDAGRLLADLASPLVRAAVVDDETAARDLRTAKVALVIVPGKRRTYRYDATRPEGRLARLLVDDVMQRAEGRADASPVADERVTAVGARYIDFVVPGLAGLNLMSSSMWGIGYAIVDMRTKKLVKQCWRRP